MKRSKFSEEQIAYGGFGMKPYTVFALLASAAIITAACSGTTEPRAPGEPAIVDFQTDSSSYTLAAGSTAYQAIISVSYTNRTGDTVFFTNCAGATGLQLEKLVNGAWVPVWAPIMPSCLSPSIVVAPNATWRTRIDVFGAYPELNAGPKFSVTDIPGTYRAIWLDATAGGTRQGDVLPEEHRVSNVFALSVHPRPLS